MRESIAKCRESTGCTVVAGAVAGAVTVAAGPAVVSYAAGVGATGPVAGGAFAAAQGAGVAAGSVMAAAQSYAMAGTTGAAIAKGGAVGASVAGWLRKEHNDGDTASAGKYSICNSKL